MCDPVTAMVVGAAAVQGFGAIQQGQAADKTGKYNAAVNMNNAAISEQNATYSSQAGEISAQNQGLKNRAELGATLANQGASGVSVNKGSSVDVRASQEAVGMLDTQTIRANAAREAYGYQTQTSNFKAQAALDKAAGKNAKKASYVAAAGTMLGTLATGAMGGAFGTQVATKSLGGTAANLSTSLNPVSSPKIFV